MPLHVFGMGTDGLAAQRDCPDVRTGGDLPKTLHGELARRRVYLHPMRWTSLGLSLLEAMHLGMPVVALATTEAHGRCRRKRASSPTSTSCSAARGLVDDPEQRGRGAAARATRWDYGLGRFHDRLGRGPGPGVLASSRRTTGWFRHRRRKTP